MKRYQHPLILSVLLVLPGPALFADGQDDRDAWVKEVENREQRGKLADRRELIRGDTGKWRDDPLLQIAPSIASKPEKSSIDDWADQLLEKKFSLVGGDEVWLIYRTHQLDDNDRVWVERVERKGNEFTVTWNEAIWQGRYNKTFTYYQLAGINLGRLPPGEYRVKWVTRPLEFREFEGDGRPRGNWCKDEKPADRESSPLVVSFNVAEPADAE